MTKPLAQRVRRVGAGRYTLGDFQIVGGPKGWWVIHGLGLECREANPWSVHPTKREAVEAVKTTLDRQPTNHLGEIL